jgi:hypothetical protein
MGEALRSVIDRGHSADPPGMVRFDLLQGLMTNFLGRFLGLDINEQTKMSKQSL